MMKDRKIKTIIDEIRPEAVQVNGLEGTLRKLSKYFEGTDYEKIKCTLRNDGNTGAWDKFLDVLKYSSMDAFEEYVTHILSDECPSPKYVKEKIEKVCRQHGLGELIRDKDDSDGMGRYQRSSVGSWKSKDSFESFGSFERDELFLATDKVARNGDTACQKRERFRSIPSQDSDEDLGECRRAKSIRSSKGSMDANKTLSIESSIGEMPPKLRRELGDLLDRQDYLDKGWRRLAEELLENNEIQKLQESPDKTPAILDCMQHNLMKVKDLVDMLLKIQRLDCVQLIENAGVELPLESSTQLRTNRNGKVRVENGVQSQSILQETTPPSEETTPPSESEVFCTSGKSQASYGDVQMNVQGSGAPSQLPMKRDVTVRQESEQEDNFFNDWVAGNISGREKYLRSKSMPSTSGRESTIYHITKETKAVSFDKDKICFSSLEVEEKGLDSEPLTTDALHTPVLPYDLDGRTTCQETVDKTDSTAGEMSLVRSKDEIPEENSYLEKEVLTDDKTSGCIETRQQMVPPKQECTYEIPEKQSCLGKEVLTDDKTSGCIETRQQRVPPKQEVYESLPPTKGGPQEYLQYTLPFARATGKFKIQIPSSTSGVDSRSKTDIGLLKESLSTNLSQTTVSNTPSSPCSPRTEKAWIDSENFRKQLDLHSNLSVPLPSLSSSPPLSISSPHSGSKEAQDCRHEERAREFSNSWIGLSETKKLSIEGDESSTYAIKGLMPADDKTNLLVSSQEQDIVPCVQSPHQENSPLLENNTDNSVLSIFTSMVINLFEKMGRGRRPHMAERADAGASVMMAQPTRISRELSSNSAVPSEHSEFHNGGSGGNGFEMAKGKSYCNTLHNEDKHNAETKSIRGSKLDSKYHVNEGRFALLINNHAYKSLPELPSDNFVDSLGRELKQCGWQVEILSNLSMHNMKNAMENFADISKDKIALFYYFGHSIQIHGENYILPVDVECQALKTKAHLKKYAIILDFIQSKMTKAKGSVVILDAGRALSGLTEKQGFAGVKERQCQCVLFTSSRFSNERYMADLLGRRLHDSESIRSVKEWIAPFKNDFEIFSVSRRLLPLPIKVPDGECVKNVLDYSNHEAKRMAFFSKANGGLEQTGQLDGKWIVNLNTSGNDLETDFSVFLKTADDENLACYLFYYEGVIEMDNGELLLKQTGLTSSKEPPTLAMILEMLSETVLGPRIVVINATESNFNVNDFNADQYNLQETLFMISPSHNEGKQKFYNAFICTLKQESVDIEQELTKLCKDFDFKLFNCSLFNI